MDKLAILLMKMNKAIDAYEAENQIPPIVIYSGLKAFKSPYTIKGVPIEYDENLQPLEFEVK